MAEAKTRKNTASVKEFIAAVPDEQRRKDSAALLKLMTEATGEKPAMWGPSIVGFGTYKGKTGEWMRAGFSPRKQNLVVYIMPGFDEYEALLGKLGPHSTGKSCLYLNRMADVDTAVLRKLVEKSMAAMRKQYPD